MVTDIMKHPVWGRCTYCSCRLHVIKLLCSTI